MANFLRLIAVLFLVASSPAFAIWNTKPEAKAACLEAVAIYQGGLCESPWKICDCNSVQEPYLEYEGAVKLTITRPQEPEYAYTDFFPYIAGDPPPDCESRNTDPEQAPGSRLSLAEDVGTRCVAGCALEPVDMIETVQGRVQGQPAVFYRYTQTYSGELCEDDTPPEETDFSPDPADPDRVCNPQAGVCVTGDDTEYCTFNLDGTPSACVPATDYDEDGTPDEDDPYPDDQQNGDDEGEGNETDNSASGGGTCGAAPACSGDGIACAILFQTWKTRCAVEKLDASGGVPGGEDGGVDTTGMGNANDFGHAGVTAADAWRPEGEGTAPQFDMGGWLGGSRSCPSLPVIDVMGVTLDFNNADLCWFMAIGGQLVLVFAALACIRIYGRVF